MGLEPIRAWLTSTSSLSVCRFQHIRIRRPSGSRTPVPYGKLSPCYRDSHINTTYLYSDGVANHPSDLRFEVAQFNGIKTTSYRNRRLLIVCSCLNKHPTIVWARYLLSFHFIKLCSSNDKATYPNKPVVV